MEIKTKFEIEDLLSLKTDRRDKDRFHALIVMEITSETCYSGTQIFYVCRMISGEKIYSMTESGVYEWAIGHIKGSDKHDTGWKRYREDELIKSSKEVVKIIRGTS